MTANILISENRDLPILREIGFVSTTALPARAEAIAQLAKETIRLGGNALILLRVGNTISDPHFPSNEFYAHGVAVEI